MRLLRTTRIATWWWLLLMVVVATANNRDATVESLSQEEDEEVQILHETIAAGRGDRDEIGVRDQWSSTDHIGEKYSIRREPSDKVKSLLQSYRLKCDGCNHDEAVAKINEFVLETKRLAQERKRKEAQRRVWLKQLALWATVAAVLGGTGYWLYCFGGVNNTTINTGGFRLGGEGSGAESAGGRSRRMEIEEQRLRAAARLRKEEEAKRMAKEAAPTWRENEEKEIWTPQQEKQFARALVSFGGVPAKARYTLIADKVNGKSRQECLMHHKLQQLIAKEQQQ